MSKLKKCVGKEAFQRMNYLYQISNILCTENAVANTAATISTNLLINISKRTVQKLDVVMKRTICKGCRGLLLAGINAKVRVKKKKVIWTCLKCTTAKCFDIKNKDYALWCENKDSELEILDYSQQDQH